MDVLFAQRIDPAVDAESDRVVAEQYQAHPDDFEVVWRAARWKVWKADTAPNDQAKQKLAKEAWVAGDLARKLKPNNALGHYYAGAAVGLYAQGLGILNALAEGIEGKFNERIDTAIKLDWTVDKGGPLLSKGRYWYELPWPMRNLDKSKELLGKVVAKYPENLRAQLYLSETLLKDGKAVEAKAALDKVVNGASDYDTAEAKRMKDAAKVVAPRIQKSL